MLKVLFVTSRHGDVRELFYKTRGIWRVSTVREPSDAPQTIASASFDLILFDIALTGAFSPDLLRHICSEPRHPPVCVLSREYAFAFQNMAASAGALAFFHIPYDIPILVSRINRILEAFPAQTGAMMGGNESDPGDADCGGTLSGSPLLGKSPVMEQLRATIRAFRPRTEPVLIIGETGSGKDLAARLIHQNSPVSSGPFIVQNVSCIPATLAESLLFGTTRASYTGSQDRKGLFEDAHKGSLFLDEIGELEPFLQPKFLRVLEDKEVSRVGSTGTTKVDFRLICATNRNMAESVRKGEFRLDLFQRIDVLRLEIPPLRERPEDIPLLAAFHLQSYQKVLSHHALEKLHAYRWPGNVRQLFNCLVRAACSAHSEVIHSDHIRF